MTIWILTDYYADIILATQIFKKYFDINDRKMFV